MRNSHSLFVNMPRKLTSIRADQRVRLTVNTLQVWRRRRDQLGIRFDEDFTAVYRIVHVESDTDSLDHVFGANSKIVVL